MSTTTEPHPAIAGCIEACRRCEAALDQLAELVRAGRDGEAHAVGAHLRHCLDHFACFEAGLDRGLVDYDARERDPRLEQDPESIRQRLGAIRDFLRSLGREGLRGPVRVSQMAAPEAGPVVVESSLERELMFLSGHTIHHLAVIAELARQEGVELPEDIAVAFSTAAHRAASV